MAEQTTIVDRIRTLANARGYSLTTLEVQLSLGNGTISRWTKSSPNTDKLAKVADFFNVSIDYLLGRENEEPLINGDEELTEYVEMLKNRPECRMLFQLSRNATKEDVEAAVRIIEALRK